MILAGGRISLLVADAVQRLVVFGGAWVGNGYGTVARSTHESKRSGLLGYFGSGMAG